MLFNTMVSPPLEGKLHRRGGLFNKSHESHREHWPPPGICIYFPPGCHHRQWQSLFEPDRLPANERPPQPSPGKNQLHCCRYQDDQNFLESRKHQPPSQDTSIIRCIYVLSSQQRNDIVLPSARECLPKRDPLSRDSGKMGVIQACPCSATRNRWGGLNGTKSLSPIKTTYEWYQTGLVSGVFQVTAINKARRALCKEPAFHLAWRENTHLLFSCLSI